MAASSGDPQSNPQITAQYDFQVLLGLRMRLAQLASRRGHLAYTGSSSFEYRCAATCFEQSWDHNLPFVYQPSTQAMSQIV
jgi:hypothetical protein